MLQLIAPVPISNLESLPDKPRFRATYDRLAHRIAAVAERDFVPINIDIPSAITVILGAAQNILALRDKIVKSLPDFDIRNVDDLQDCALALGHAHTRLLAASAPANELPELKAQAMRMRRSLRIDLTVLQSRGFLPPKALARIRNTTGPQHVAFDLFALAHIARSNWSSIAGKTALQLSELEAAERLGSRLMKLLGRKDGTDDALRAASRVQQQAFTLLKTTYAQVQGAVAYVVDDAEELERIAPSLYGPRVRKPRGKKRAQGQGASSNANSPQLVTVGARRKRSSTRA